MPGTHRRRARHSSIYSKDLSEIICANCSHSLEHHYCFKDAARVTLGLISKCEWSKTIYVRVPDRWWWPFGKSHLRARSVECNCKWTPDEVKANWEYDRTRFSLEVEI